MSIKPHMAVFYRCTVCQNYVIFYNWVCLIFESFRTRGLNEGFLKERKNKFENFGYLKKLICEFTPIYKAQGLGITKGKVNLCNRQYIMHTVHLYDLHMPKLKVV